MLSSQKSQVYFLMLNHFCSSLFAKLVKSNFISIGPIRLDVS